MALNSNLYKDLKWSYLNEPGMMRVVDLLYLDTGTSKINCVTALIESGGNYETAAIDLLAKRELQDRKWTDLILESILK